MSALQVFRVTLVKKRAAMVNGKSTKYGQVIWADTSLRTALSASPPRAVELDMYVPTLARAKGACTTGSKCSPASSPASSLARGGRDPEETLGGFMAVPVVAASFGSHETTADAVQSYCRLVCCDRLLVVIDTGSEGYFVQDDTGCSQHDAGHRTVPSFLEYCQQRQLATNPAAGMSLTLGELGKSTFTVQIPLQWFTMTAEEVSGAIAPINSVQRTQTIIVGNSWLQAVAITWNATRGGIAFSHLDSQGYRCAQYQGPPRSSSSYSVEAKQALAAFQRIDGAPVKNRKARWSGISLSGRELSLAPRAGKVPITDTVIDVRFMRNVSEDEERNLDSYGGVVQSIETTDPSVRSEPCLDAIVQLQDGTTAHVCPVFDTGSERSLVTQNTLSFAAENVHLGSNSCVNGDVTVGSEFRRLAGHLASVRACGSLAEAQCSNQCCQTCCLAPDTTADTHMPCSVSYCTGMLSYEPGSARLTFPLENATANMRDVLSPLGRATPRCLPAPHGVWGCWFWTQTTTGGTTTQATVHSLPYYVLSHLGVDTPELSNMTFRVWRTDTSKESLDACTVVGKLPLTREERANLTRRVPVWQERPSTLNSAPFSSGAQAAGERGGTSSSAGAQAPGERGGTSSSAGAKGPGERGGTSSSVGAQASGERGGTSSSAGAQGPGERGGTSSSVGAQASGERGGTSSSLGASRTPAGTVEAPLAGALPAVQIHINNSNSNASNAPLEKSDEVGPAALVPAWMLLVVAIACLVIMAAGLLFLRPSSGSVATPYHGPQSS